MKDEGTPADPAERPPTPGGAGARATSPGLPAGLSLRAAAAPLERVETQALALQLMLAAPGLELATGTLLAGNRLTLVPAAGPGRALEAYLILEGRLRREAAGTAEEVGPGDTLIADGLREESVFSALTDVRFAYVTTQPFFHELSVKLADLMRLAVKIEARDGYTAEHCDRLQALSYAAGRELGLTPDRLHVLDYGSYLHDVGKARIPLEILRKPGQLDEREWALMKQHPQFGREMLDETFMRAAGPIVEQHHERMDGSGYPYGLASDEILPEAYLVAIADTFDAMTTDRPYRKALPREVALAEIHRLAGVTFPAEFVRAFRAGLESFARAAGARRRA